MNQIPNIEEGAKKAIEQVLLNRIKHIGDEDQLYTGYPAQLVEELAQTFNHQLQKAREQRKGWKGYVAVDPQAGHYKYSPVFSDRKGAELWVKGKEISGLEVVEVDILLADHSELDQPNK